MTDDESPIFCDRCTKQLTSGRGEFYLVNIEAVADPSPPVIDERDFEFEARDAHSEFSTILKEAEQFSNQELMDQVFRRLTLYLCNSCYARWIENPTSE